MTLRYLQPICCSPFPPGVPHEPNRTPVSSPRRIKPSVQISCTGLSCVSHQGLWGRFVLDGFQLTALAASVSLQRSVLPSLPNSEFGLWTLGFRGHLCVHFRYRPMTCSPSLGWLCRSTPCAS